jgi:hypothetical protein
MVTRSPLKRLLIAAALVLGLLAFAPGTASADTTYFLGAPNPGISAFTGPYAEVTVHLVDSTHATITFDALSSASNLYWMGGVGAAGVNVNASSFSASGLSGTAKPGGSGVDLSFSGAGNEDGFGSFNLTIDEFDGFSWALKEIKFTVTNTSGGTWASSANVLTNNGTGFLAASHIFVANLDGSNTGATGFAGNGNSSNAVPEPSTIALALSGLVGVGFAGLRRLRRPQAATV